jgi:hypothetical protein
VVVLVKLAQLELLAQLVQMDNKDSKVQLEVQVLLD